MDPRVFSPKPDFLLRVRGMSMRDAGILDGDLVAVHRATDVRNGQIVVARLGDEVTVKRYRQQGPEVWLMPENPEFNPIVVDTRRQELLLEGVVVGVMRDAKVQ
jgi:repressor LexA